MSLFLVPLSVSSNKNTLVRSYLVSTGSILSDLLPEPLWVKGGCRRGPLNCLVTLSLAPLCDVALGGINDLCWAGTRGQPPWSPVGLLDATRRGSCVC